MKPELYPEFDKLWEVQRYRLRQQGIELGSLDEALEDYERHKKQKEQDFEALINTRKIEGLKASAVSKAVQEAIQGYRKTGILAFESDGVRAEIGAGIREGFTRPLEAVDGVVLETLSKNRYLLFKSKANSDKYLELLEENHIAAQRMEAEGRDEAFIKYHPHNVTGLITGLIISSIELIDVLPGALRAMDEVKKQALSELGVLPRKPVIMPLYRNGLLNGVQPIWFISFPEVSQ